MQTANETVINVPELEPRLKHSTIFQTFNNLKPGESMIIHNDHDPKPVYYQLSAQHGETFSWEYLQQGPEVWNIRVTKNETANEEVEAVTVTHKEKGREIKITAPLLAPQIKHATIFQAFNHLGPDDVLIIHNDHDPRPLHYHLMSEHGEIFNWEYLQSGPEWWDVCITMKPLAPQAKPDASNVLQMQGVSKKGDDIVITVPEIEPRRKHPTIFEVFDTLQPLESLIIHNDHDPKPVYYQLLGERGDVFTWQYLQQGPQWWDIKVTRKDPNDTETIGQIAAKDLRKAEVFKKYGIDFCCGGKKTVREICAEKGIDATKVEQELQAPIQSVTTNTTMNFNEWNVDFLADYIVNTHHNYVRKYLPEIYGYMNKVAKVHGDRHPELLNIQNLVELVNKDLSEHIVEEEKDVFPLVKKIVQAKNANSVYPEKGSFAAKVVDMEKEHETVGNALDEIREISNNYALPDDACASYKLLFKMLDEFENDIHIHIHLENNILFPKVVEMEKSLA